MALNLVEQKLKEIYDGWDMGSKAEDNGYSSMFRMGFPEEYIDSQRPLLMYVGQECLRCNKEKTQAWVRLYQEVQSAEKRITNDWFSEETNRSPFWNFYRRLADLGFDVLWNNLDKFHPQNSQRLSKKDSVRFNQPYGKEMRSVLQREIELVKPKVIVLAVGNGKYISAIAAAFSVCEDKLKECAPKVDRHIVEISSVVKVENARVFWTYHPAYLQRKHHYYDVLKIIERVEL